MKRNHIMKPLGEHLIALFDSGGMAPHTCGMDDELPPAGIPPEEWAASPLTVRQFIGALLTVVAQQQQQLVQHHAQVADLDAFLKQHSQNTSKPPSSDPPSAPPLGGDTKVNWHRSLRSFAQEVRGITSRADLEPAGWAGGLPTTFAEWISTRR
jgi:hypothetical protein